MLSVYLVLDQRASIEFQTFMRFINRKIKVYPYKEEVAFEEVLDLKIDVFVIDIDLLGKKKSREMAKKIRDHILHEYTWLMFISSDNDLEYEMYRTYKCREYFIKGKDKYNIQSQVLKLLEHPVSRSSEVAERYLHYQKSGKKFRILLNQIKYIEIYYKKCTVHTTNESYDLGRVSLSQLQPRLNGTFLQCHRSYIVNSKFVENVVVGEDGTYASLKVDDDQVPVGRMYKEEFINKINMRSS